MAFDNSLSRHFDSLPGLPDVDHSLFGEVEIQELPRAQRFGGQFLARNWAMIPHVTHHDEADITDLEFFRAQLPVAREGVRVSTPVLLLKALIGTLREFPKFNASLDGSGANLILKKFYHLGVAVDTPSGLLVPVIKDVDQKSVSDIAIELKDLATQAREKGLPMTSMEGGTFTLSSIGALGGRAFTPIINAPEVAILGATKAWWAPERGEHDDVVWRLKLPLSLSYDHRVINGADAARFLTHLNQQLQTPEALLA